MGKLDGKVAWVTGAGTGIGEAAALAALPPSFGDPAPHVMETRVHRWTGAVSGLPGGWRPVTSDAPGCSD